jgi:hypothetical protein
VAGRFPLYTDADIHGPVVEALQDVGWDVLRAVDAFPEGTKDPIHFERAAHEDRVLVTNDRRFEPIAHAWLAEGRAFRGMVCWARSHYARMSAGDFLEAFEQLAARDDPFGAYPIIHIHPKR